MDLQALFSVKNKTAVITGGSGALRSAMARGLAQAGVRVAILSLHVVSAEKVAGAIRADGDQAIGIGCNLMAASQHTAACRGDPRRLPWERVK